MAVTSAQALDQRQNALRIANEVRSRRARLKRRLKCGEVQVTPLILDPPEYLRSASVYSFLLNFTGFDFS